MFVLKPGQRCLLTATSLLLSTMLLTLPFSTAFSQNTNTVCQSSLSDPDGDGWGWENGKSCMVAGSETANIVKLTTAYCLRASSDTDGDGWGWENNGSCKVNPAARSATIITGIPVCLSKNSDTDGDGYGWENSSTCVVQQSGNAIPENTFCNSVDADPDGDGWGWENNASCMVLNSVTNNNSIESSGTTPKKEEQSNKTGVTVSLPSEITDLILITGQSNTLGNNTTVDYSLDSPHPRVLAYTNEGWQMAELYQHWDDGGHPGIGDRSALDKIHNNFALHFGKRLAALDENIVVGIVLVAEPGMGIRNWSAGAPGMLRVEQKALTAINSLPHKSKLDGILWHQGETDWQFNGTSDALAKQPAANDYYPARFAAMLENLRLKNWFDRDTPFICGETIKGFGVNKHLNFLNNDDDNNTACVEAEGLPSIEKGGNHFNASALRTLGQRYADRYNLIR